jgi:hypothetical protein
MVSLGDIEARELKASPTSVETGFVGLRRSVNRRNCDAGGLEMEGLDGLIFSKAYELREA